MSSKSTTSRVIGRRIVSRCIVALLLGATAEGAARVAIAYKARLVGLLPAITGPLHEYQERDPRHPNSWRLKAGFVNRFGDVMTEAQRGDNRADEIFVRINADGFRGPELDRSRLHRRILTLGDSGTFGTIERFSYPRVIERELQRRGHGDVEVVNGGVEGYSPRDVLYQIERYTALHPSIITLYIGWGSLYGERHAVDSPNAWARLESIGLVSRTVAHLVAAAQDPKVREEQERRVALEPKHPDARAPEIGWLDTFVPTFMPDVEKIMHVMKTAGARPVLITLPGLFTMDTPVTERAMKIANLPAFTDNPYVLAKMGERYNAELRKLGEREGVSVIDLDAWSRGALKPRDAHFVNSVHLTEEAQEMAGRYLAGEIDSALGPMSSRR